MSMKRIRWVLIACLLGCASPALGQRVEMRTGSIMLLPGYAHQAYRGTDSAPGVIQRSDGTLVINYDIGGMAGIHMSPERRPECAWLIEHTVNGLRAYTGMIIQGTRREVITTILSDFVRMPANFTAEVHDDRDLAEFMVIVGSYVPRDGS
jgi:hypothetical protein